MRETKMPEASSPALPVCLIQMRQSYGQVRIYPKNRVAVSLLGLTGRKTFKQEDLVLIEALGFEIQWVPMGLEGVCDEDAK